MTEWERQQKGVAGVDKTTELEDKWNMITFSARSGFSAPKVGRGEIQGAKMAAAPVLQLTKTGTRSQQKAGGVNPASK